MLTMKRLADVVSHVGSAFKPNNIMSETPQTPAAPAAKKEKQTLQITCIVTGKSRLTNQVYLAAKAARLGVEVKDVTSNYINRAAMKLLRAGKTLAEVRTALGTEGEVKELSEKRLKRAIELNGKHKVAKEPAAAPAA